MTDYKAEYWVTATDSAMSGWGPATGKTNKLAIACDSYEEAQIVVDNLNQRSEMKCVSVRSDRPEQYDYRNPVLISYKTKQDEIPGMYWTPGAFK